MRYNEVSINPKSRGLLPSRLRRATVSLRLGHARALTPHRGVIHYPRATSLPLGGRLFADPIITQIGRENNLSAEIWLWRVAEDVDPYECCVKHPYEKLRKRGFFVL